MSVVLPLAIMLMLAFIALFVVLLRAVKRSLPPEVFVVSYANGGIHATNQESLGATANALGYSHVKYNPSMIADFIARHPEHFRHQRGAGYWLWKPEIMIRELERMPDNKVLLYVDAGTHLLSRVDPLLQQYPDKQLFVFEPDNDWRVKAFTKRDLLLHLGVDTPEMTDTKQIEAGLIIARKGALPIIRKWLEIASDPHMIDDSPSRASEYPEFVEHRHDQAILDILAKQDDRVLILQDKAELVNHHRRRA